MSHRPFRILRDRIDASKRRGVQELIKKIRKPTPPPGHFHDTSGEDEKQAIKELKEELAAWEQAAWEQAAADSYWRLEEEE
jgi:hypothetical protein